VEPKHIVGAIANEANIKSRDIGQIKINHDHCLVDLPQNMPSATFRLLQKVWVCGQQLQISPVDDSYQAQDGKTKRKFGTKDGERKSFKPGGKKPPRNRRGSYKS
jgi:ATP-dependent RNA helicase DeaD